MDDQNGEEGNWKEQKQVDFFVFVKSEAVKGRVVRVVREGEVVCEGRMTR